MDSSRSLKAVRNCETEQSEKGGDYVVVEHLNVDGKRAGLASPGLEL